MERLRTLNSSESALAALRRYINRPAAIFDKYEAVELLQSLLRLARNENHQKADEYAAALDEIKTKSDFVDDQQLQRLFLCLNFGPSSELGANEGVVPLLLVYFRVFSFIKFLPFLYRVLFHFIPKLVLLLLLPVISRCVVAGDLPFRWLPSFAEYGRCFSGPG